MTQFFPSDQRTIGSRTFIVTACNTDDGCRLFFKLIKICGPAMSRFLRALDIGDEVALEQLSVGVAADALDEVIRGLDEVTFKDFYATFAKNTQLITDEGGQLPLLKVGPAVFSADYGTMVKWMAFAMQVNFSSFLSDLASTVPLVSMGAARANRSPAKSTGGSTE